MVANCGIEILSTLELDGTWAINVKKEAPRVVHGLTNRNVVVQTSCFDKAVTRFRSSLELVGSHRRK